MGEIVAAGGSVNGLQYASDFEGKLKRGEEGIDLESIKISGKAEVLQLKVIVPGNTNDRRYWDFITYYLESRGINASGEATSLSAKTSVETNIEVFKKNYLIVENQLPIVIAEFTTGFGELTNLKIQRVSNTKKLLLKLDDIEFETEASLKLEKTGLYLVSEDETLVNLIPNLISSIKSIKVVESETSLVSEKVYEVSGSKSGKFLGLIQIKIPITALVNPNSGKIESIEKPWWSFLVW
jgi:hypothetical protein